MRFRLLTLFALFSSLLPAQPLPFSNPHPLSIAHFNPTMEGDGEQQGVYFRETSFFENRGYLADGNIYHFTIDMEVSELLYRTRQSFGRWPPPTKVFLIRLSTAYMIIWAIKAVFLMKKRRLRTMSSIFLSRMPTVPLFTKRIRASLSMPIFLSPPPHGRGAWSAWASAPRLSRILLFIRITASSPSPTSTVSSGKN